MAAAAGIVTVYQDLAPDDTTLARLLFAVPLSTLPGPTSTPQPRAPTPAASRRDDAVGHGGHQLIDPPDSGQYVRDGAVS